MSSPSTGRVETTSEDKARPLALIATVKNAVQLTAIDDAARAAGLSPGMTLSHARALIPDIETEPADPGGDRLALEKLADWCRRYSPSSGLHDEPDDHGIWIDATGCAHLFGGEKAMLTDLEQRLTRFGLRHRLALASTPGAAWALARYGGDSGDGGNACSVDMNNEREILKSLSVAALRLAPETVILLRRLGLKTIGQLNALPRAALGKRFSSKEAGEAVLMRLDQLFGRREEPLHPRKPAPIYRTEQAFLEPLIDLDTLTHGLTKLTSELCQILNKAGQGAEKMTFLAFRVDGDVKALQVGASQPTHDADHIGRLFTEKLPTIDPGFGIEKLALHAERTATIDNRQKNLEGDTSDVTAQDERVSQLIDRLAGRLGANAITISTPKQSHIPERQAAPGLACEGRTTPGMTARAWAAMPPLPPRPSCLLLRPEPIKALAEVPDGPPLRFTWRRVTRRIVKSEGPERIAPTWVGAANSVDLAAETRDYYRVEDDEGRRYWLFRQGLYDRAGYGDAERHGDDADPIGWYIHGVFG